MTKRTITLLCAAALFVAGAAADARASQEMLASAKSLYESASYEAALPDQGAGFITATIGALVVLFIWNRLVASRVISDPGNR
jgi:hypothetical protein